MKYNRLLKCSDCGRILGTYPKYCPHCGGSPMTTDSNPRIIDVPGTPKPKQAASAAPREQGNWWEPQNTGPRFDPPPIPPPPETKTYTQPPPAPARRPTARPYEQPRPMEKAPREKPPRDKKPKIKPPISEQERLINRLSAASTAVVLIVIVYFLAGHYYDKWKDSRDRWETMIYAEQSIGVISENYRFDKTLYDERTDS